MRPEGLSVGSCQLSVANSIRQPPSLKLRRTRRAGSLKGFQPNRIEMNIVRRRHEGNVVLGRKRVLYKGQA